MRIIITNESVYEWAAYYTVKCILDYADQDKPFVLSFPLRYVNKSYYQKLLSFYNDNIVSFKNIHITNHIYTIAIYHNRINGIFKWSLAIIQIRRHYGFRF